MLATGFETEINHYKQSLQNMASSNINEISHSKHRI
jgi:hypothetical protein